MHNVLNKSLQELYTYENHQNIHVHGYIISIEKNKNSTSNKMPYNFTKISIYKIKLKEDISLNYKKKSLGIKRIQQNNVHFVKPPGYKKKILIKENVRSIIQFQYVKSGTAQMIDPNFEKKVLQTILLSVIYTKIKLLGRIHIMGTSCDVSKEIHHICFPSRTRWLMELQC